MGWYSLEFEFAEGVEAVNIPLAAEKWVRRKKALVDILGKSSPDGGLEPPTTRLRVVRSTD